MPNERIGDVETVVTADHPPRKDSATYTKSRKWLMGEVAGGCFVCGGPVDLTLTAPGSSPQGKVPDEDHHGMGLYLERPGQPPVLIGFGLFGMEWSLGFGANPAKVAKLVADLNAVNILLGAAPYAAEIVTGDDVETFVDSVYNANIRLCKPHHTGHETSHTPDVNGNEACGIHNGPFPIWLGQVTCDWERPWDMWGGSTGTIAVAPPADGSKSVTVMHVSPLHPDAALYAAHQASLKTGEALVLPSSHPHARLAHAGSHVAAA
jgi:hypothetical protein